MTVDIEQIKREVHEELGYPEHPISRVIDHLHSRGYLGGVPGGYVLVPKEPTLTMLQAGQFAWFDIKKDALDRFPETYKAMIAAAPKGETK